jgi:rubredoxin
VSDEIQAPQDPAIQNTTDSEPKSSETISDEVVTELKVRAPEKTLAEQASDPLTHRFECRSCGFVYDPEEGVKKLRIESGTAFQQLDAFTFRCPVCRSRVGAFRDIGPRSKASGFEENLDFGLGVNRLTPGQKNVLIFGSLALGFAFFLSLYSLR